MSQGYITFNTFLISILICFCVSLSDRAFSLPPGELTVKGLVTHEGTPYHDVEIRVFNRNSLIRENIHPDRKGQFRVDLPLGGYYVLEFRSKGMITKRFIFKTSTPDPNKSYHPFDIEVMMLEEGQLNGEIDMDFPMAIVKFFPEKGDFHYVDDYTRKRLKAQSKALSETLEH